ncbi:MAG: tetratricopeptide repeat protein [Candidatus Krumholzibacteriia bacterium]
MRRLQRQVRQAPEDPVALRHLCAALCQRGRREEAVLLVRSFMQRAGDAHLDEMGSILMHLGAYEIAADCYLRLAQLHPSQAAPVCKLGLLYAKTGDEARARAEFERATRLEPRSPETWYRLGTFLLRKRVLDEAETCLRRALQADSTYARAHTNLGFLLDLRGERSNAVHEFQKALQLAPGDPENHFNLGALYAESGSHELAIEQFQAGIALAPQSVEGHYNLGAVYFEQRRYDDSILAFRRALKLQPDHEEALYYLGLGYLRKGLYDRALDTLEQVARDHPPSVRLLYAIGLCYNGLEMPRQAVRVLSQVIGLAPDHAKAHHLLGICLDKLGDREHAGEAYRRSDLFLSLARARRGAARLDRS